jgi:hypothetical protein
MKNFVAAFMIAALAAVSASAQDASLKDRAARSGLSYRYDKFEDFDSVRTADLPNSGIMFSYAGYVGKEHLFAIVILNSVITYDNDAIFLIDGERFKVVPNGRHYRQFATALERSLISRIASAKECAVKVGYFEYEFSHNERAQIGKLLEIANDVTWDKTTQTNRKRK